MLKQYFKLDLWHEYVLALMLLGLTILFLGFIGPTLVSAASTFAVLLGLILVFLVYPFLMFVFGKPLYKRLRRRM